MEAGRWKAEIWNLKAGRQKVESGRHKLEAGMWKAEVGSCMLEAGSWNTVAESTVAHKYGGWERYHGPEGSSTADFQLLTSVLLPTKAAHVHLVQL